MSNNRPNSFIPALPSPEDLPLKQTVFRGRVVKVHFSNEESLFAIALFSSDEHDSAFSIKGTIPAIVAGEELQIEGEWKNETRFGWGFHVSRYERILPSTSEGLASYLGSGMVKGVGPGFAQKIVKHFGDETLSILNDHPERLIEVKGLGKERAASIASTWTQHQDANDALLLLQQEGISPAIARRLYKQFGRDAAAIIRSNPYRASIEVHGIGFEKADQMARKFGIERESPERIKAGFHHLLLKASGEGHTYIIRENLIHGATELLRLDAPLVEQVFDSIASLQDRIYTFSLKNGQSCVALKSLYLAETGVARLVLQLMNSAQPLIKESVAERLNTFEATYRFTLAAQQREAIIRMLSRGGVGVITGGPGTGKTTLIRALLWCVKDTKTQIGLCSPTGRAAQRLSETTNSFALTIHRMLKYNPQERGFTHGPDLPLPVNLLIVDEASMLDIPLAYQLLRAVTPTTTVIFVGDVDQLPSVGPGALLLDLIESQRPTITRLDVIFRQASQSAIIQNSHKINRGALPDLGEPNKKTLQDFFFIPRENAQSLQESLLELITKRIPQRFSFDAIRDVQILTPMRRGTLGTESLNVLLQNHLNHQNPPTQIGSLALRLGDKVIQTSNNYDLDVYNGDIGYVERISADQLTFAVAYGKRTVEYAFSEVDQLQLAYAITIHKSQGSEYPVCIIILHTQHFTLLQRNLLYTGVTRGKKLVLLLGNKKAVQLAVHNHNSHPRVTGLQEWLHYPPQKSLREGSGSLFEE